MRLAISRVTARKACGSWTESPWVPRAAMATQVAPGPVEPGQLEIVVGIEARYRIAPR